VLKQASNKNFLANVNRVGQFFNESLKILKGKVDFIAEIRGMGLHLGIELTRPGSGLVTRALDRGLIINCTSEKVIRIMPPLNITLNVARAGMKIIENVFLEERGKSENS
jgi:acetylornithine/N-succinyldiaminopimelate aminotransferase